MNLSLVIDSTYKYSDVWKPCFGQLDKFFSTNINKYLCTDIYDTSINTSNLIPIYYDNNDSYRNQFLGCLRQIPEKYILYISEDYILYDTVKMNIIETLVDVLETDTKYHFIKLLRGPEKVFEYSEKYPYLHIIDKNDSNFFAQQVTIWNKDALINVFQSSNYYNDRMQQEPGGSEICRRIGINGLQYFSGNEIKRGQYHYDSSVFPCIATAVVKGKWNELEYSKELTSIFKEYGIDKTIRGVYEGR